MRERGGGEGSEDAAPLIRLATLGTFSRAREKEVHRVHLTHIITDQGESVANQ